jgi:predicted nucleic acid-binding protein
MIIVVDSTSLALLINPTASPPKDPSTGDSLKFAKERIELLVASLTANDSLVVPTPVLAEVLVKAEDGAPEVLRQILGSNRVRIAPFDTRAATEIAGMTRAAIEAGDKRAGSDQPWQKVKFDRQIIAIARVAGASKIYSDDKDLANFARVLGIEVVSTWDLPIPESAENLFTASGLGSDGKVDAELEQPQQGN